MQARSPAGPNPELYMLFARVSNPVGPSHPVLGEGPLVSLALKEQPHGTRGFSSITVAFRRISSPKPGLTNAGAPPHLHYKLQRHQALNMRFRLARMSLDCEASGHVIIPQHLLTGPKKFSRIVLTHFPHSSKKAHYNCRKTATIINVDPLTCGLPSCWRGGSAESPFTMLTGLEMQERSASTAEHLRALLLPACLSGIAPLATVREGSIQEIAE